MYAVWHLILWQTRLWDIFYKSYLLGVPQDLAKALAKIGAITTSVNAVIAVIVATIIYLALRPVMKKTGMLREL